MSTLEDHILLLIPAPISQTDINWSIPSLVIKQINEVQCFIVENAKTARYFLKQLNSNVDYEALMIFELNKHDINSQLNEIRKLLSSYAIIGLMSEAGMPCMADPGHQVVRIAHDLDIRVKPLSGPSSIVLALIASGLNGQQFKFNGYLPVKPDERRHFILHLEKEAAVTTQLFIEAPYRNDKILSDLIKTLNPATRLLVAIDITGLSEKIICKTVSWWKTRHFEIGKVPCLFGIGI